jgi:toxin ParE1/3/4
LTPVLFHPGAEAELDQSIGFYEECQPGLGLDFQREVFRGISKIHDAPTLWPKHKYGTRKFLLNRFPFYIYYLELSDCIWIAAVAHCSRKPNYWKDRLKKSPERK